MQNRPIMTRWQLACWIAASWALLSTNLRAADIPSPNIVIIYADDLGYGDLGCNGNMQIKTPHLDQLAKEGMRGTSFYVAQAVCSASRTALLTGCYPNRLGILGALGPKSKTGIHSQETTLAELCASRGYATAIYGKWHLGDQPPFLPTRHGFDDYFGLPYSNDMWPKHPSSKFPDLPLFSGEKIVETNPDQRQLTQLYTQHATAFIRQSKEKNKPFFLYVPHSMPHVPLHVSPERAGKSAAGMYGDVIEELDWSVGEIVKTLTECQLIDNTLVIFASDNGPWLTYGNHAGSSGGFREGKATTFEGGVRVPFLAHWPGKIPAGSVSAEPLMTIDIFPTVAKLIGAELPQHSIDGLDAWPVISGQSGAKSPHETLFFYWGRELHAIRSGRWKLHLPHPYHHLEQAGHDGKPGKLVTQPIELSLFDLETDPGEATNVLSANPEVEKQLLHFAESARADLGDSLTQRHGSGLREPGKLEP